VNELASEALASRSRLLAQVETWVDSAGEIPLSSRPFAAEVPMTRTPTPPPPSDATPAIELRRRSERPEKPVEGEQDEEDDSLADAGTRSSGRALAVLVSIATAVVIAYLASR
jgi:hypothetical protein